jgi:hypothetical protein
VSSAVTGLDFGHGTYRIQGLPPGEYEVILQAILPQATGGSGIGPQSFQLTLPVIEEYFHKRGTSNVVTEFTRVKVEDGEVVRGIDFEINGLDTANPSFANEVDAHSTFATAQPWRPSHVSGTASIEDPFTVVSSAKGFPTYPFTMTAPRTVVWMAGCATTGTVIMIAIATATATPADRRPRSVTVQPVRDRGRALVLRDRQQSRAIGVACRGPICWHRSVRGRSRYELRVMKNV